VNEIFPFIQTRIVNTAITVECVSFPGDGPRDWPDAKQASRAVKEYLNALDQDMPETHTGGQREKPAKAISLTDPQAAWVTKRQRDRPHFVYDANYLTDNKLGFIVDAEGTRANRIEENRVCVSMVERVMTRFGLKPKRLAADTAYGILAAVISLAIVPTARADLVTVICEEPHGFRVGYVGGGLFGEEGDPRLEVGEDSFSGVSPTFIWDSSGSNSMTVIFGSTVPKEMSREQVEALSPTVAAAFQPFEGTAQRVVNILQANHNRLPLIC
jgi:hypothetical protein